MVITEALPLREQERRKTEVFEMLCLRNISGIRSEKIRNSLIRER